MIFDQGCEVHCHKILNERAGVQIYLANVVSPWQCGSNGLLTQSCRMAGAVGLLTG